MLVNVYHAMSGGLLAKMKADSTEQAKLDFIKFNPEYECETVREFEEKFPLLNAALMFITLQ